MPTENTMQNEVTLIDQNGTVYTEIAEVTDLDLTPVENENKGTPVSVTLEIEGVEYTLAYNRMAIKRMESRGFNVGAVDSKLLTSLDLMIEGAFYKNHPTLTQKRLVELRDYIVDNYDAYELMSVLSEMIANVLPKVKSEKSDFKVFIVNRR